MQHQRTLPRPESMRTALSLSLFVLVCPACSSTSTPTTVTPQSCSPSGPAASGGDQDQDGLDDAQELAWAQQYLPYISMSPQDECPTAGIAVRVSPHPAGA